MLDVIIFYSMPCSLFSFIISESNQTCHFEFYQLLFTFFRSSSETRRYRGIIRWSSSQSQPRIHLLYPVTGDHTRFVLANLVTDRTIPEYQCFV